MQTRKPLIIKLMAVLIFSSLSMAQFEEEGLGIKVKSGLEYQSFDLSINWDDDQYTSKLKSHIFSLNTQFEIKAGIRLNAIIGYALPNFSGLIFRQLPFSVELSSGKTQGILVGAGADVSFINYKDIEIGARAQFVYYKGSEKKWDIPGLSVSGTITGKPSWQRISVGPVVIYRGFDYFFPYASMGFHYFKGTFSLSQTVQTLSGSEDKEITGAGKIYIDLGGKYEFSDRFELRAEFNLFPNTKNLDFGFTLGAAYAF